MRRVNAGIQMIVIRIAVITCLLLLSISSAPSLAEELVARDPEGEAVAEGAVLAERRGWDGRRSPSASLRRPSTVHGEHGTGDIARRVAREEHGRALDFFEPRPAFQRGRADDKLFPVLRVRD